MKSVELVGQTTAELMESLELDEDPTAEVFEVAVIVLVRGKNENGADWSYLQWRFSDAHWTHKIGLLEGTIDALNAQRNALRKNNEEDL